LDGWVVMTGGGVFDLVEPEPHPANSQIASITAPVGVFHRILLLDFLILDFSSKR
jgi:hypothetical protein